MRIPLELPPGLLGDDTSQAGAGHWADGSNVRFRLGLPQVIGGWERLIDGALTGVCRTVFPWKDNGALLNIAFGTNQKLQLWKGDELFDITPFGPVAVLGGDPLTTASGSGVVTVAHIGHGLTTGQEVKLSGAETFNGLEAANLNGVREITVVDPNTYTFVAGAADTASASGAGGGAAIRVVRQSELPVGPEHGTSSIGFGTGAYGGGPYGTTEATAEYYPRTWSFDAWGQHLIANPRGGGLYEWRNDPASRALAIANAPPQVTYALVAPMNGGYMLFALGCNEEASGTFNPMCIRHSSIRNNTEWSTAASGSTSREYVLTGGGRIVAGRMIGPYMLVWTDKDLFLGSYVGSLAQPWRFDRIGRNCGLIGPNAAVVVGQTAFWISPDRQFYSYSIGGAATPVGCPIRTEFADNLAASQGDKIVASSNAEFSEVRFDYPDGRDGFENSRYVALALGGEDAGAWHKGVMARTAFVDAGPSLYPLGVDPDGAVFHHERGHTADGQAFPWFIETADSLLDPESTFLVRELWPDFKDQIGPVSVSLTARFTPQGNAQTATAPPMAPGETKADFLASGRLFRVRIAGESAPTRCRIGKPMFDVVPAGRR
ncbi:hypothetical protein [Phenylobacterium sp.]|uniref:hypothetical protein n=1 Tax=Phenylobacterium sp. TaxID=1871053 RepID=UPI003921B569